MSRTPQMPETGVETEVKTVKQLSIEMRTLLETTFSHIWVRGEVGSVTLHSSGHTYFSLKEDDCVINGICWRGTPLSTPLTSGTIVECYGRVSSYPSRSSYQIIIKEAREVNKQGNILFQLEQLKQKLIAEGIFDSSRKKIIPKYPKTIAILTSPTGAVFHDIMHRLNDRYPCCFVYFFPIAVQGDKAEAEILSALKKVDTMKDKIDTVILARGGGSIEDLWCFNNEEIVRAVAALSIPIISAIGHETDITLVDFAADLRAPTPTAAAELATPDKKDITNFMENLLYNSQTFFKEKIKQNNALLDSMKDFDYIYTNAIGNFGQKIDHLISNFENTINERISQAKLEIGTMDSMANAIAEFEVKINQYFDITYTVAKLRVNNAKSSLDQNKTFLDEKESELKEKVLITDGSSKKIVSATDLKKLKEFKIMFFDGVVDAVPKDANRL